MCSPLHGTRRARFSPTPSLRALDPGGELVRWMMATSDRLRPLLARTVCIGSTLDAFVVPTDSAFLDGATRVELTDSAHAGSLLDRRVTAAAAALARTVRSSG